MANANLFNQNLHDQIQNLVQILDALQTLNDRMMQDSTLAADAAAAANAAGRTDLAAVDFTNVGSAIQQMMFTFNSGTPATKSFFYKML
jgi:hypothetical protein